MADVEREIIEILAKTCRFDAAKSRLDDLEVNSFDVIEAVFEIEEHFDITIPYDANRSGRSSKPWGVSSAPWRS